jgi:hypothetical protein
VRAGGLRASTVYSGTVTGVHDDPFAQIAAADALPPVILEDIWRKGTSRSREIVAGRRDLPRHITEEILDAQHPSTLPSWLCTERPSEDVARIVAGRAVEIDRALTYQEQLTETQKETLSWSDTVDVLKPFLLRDDLTEDQRHRALMRYVARERILRSSYGEELINTIETAGTHDHRWARLMEVVGPDQAALIAEAAERGIRKPGVADAAARALLRVARATGDDQASLANQDLQRATRLLLRSPWVENDIYEELAELPALGPLRNTLRKRAESDTRAALGHLTCNGDPAECPPGHAAIVSVLSLSLPEIDMPSEILPGAALTHAQELPESMLDRILASIHFSPSLFERELRLGNTANQVRLIERRPNLYDPCGTYPEDLLVALARSGSRCLLGRNVPESLRNLQGSATVVTHYEPGSALLDDPWYAGRIAEALLELDRDAREVAYRLLPEWGGTIPDLVEAARSFN